MSIVLNRVDVDSACWTKLTEHYEARLEELRARNDNVTMDAVQTALMRGRIGEIKDLLALATPAPVTAVNPID